MKFEWDPQKAAGNQRKLRIVSGSSFGF